jgi:filamentous hemagglutinin family protein
MLKAQPLRTRSVFVSAIALATASLATAQPVPDQVLHHGDGTVSFLDLPGFFQINAPHQSVIQYFSFNVPGGFHVNFNQTMGGNQSPNAAVLNYIPGATPSSIFGQVTGNGIIYMVNPQGFIFGGGAEVSANRFFAAASTLSDPANFFSDPDLFNVFPATPFDPNSDPIPSVINFGSIHANEAVHLLGPLVRNFGQISTGNNGLITMTAHNGTVTLGNGGNFYVHVANGGAGIDDYGVVNTGELTTGTGGTVMLGAGDMYSLAIRLEGSGIQAANLVLGGDGANPGETNTQGDVNLGSDVIIAADNATFHGTIDSTAGDFHGLTINPFSGDGDQVTFNARVGSVDRLGHLNVNSTSININTDQIFTGTGVAVASGDQTYNGNVVLGEDTTIDSNGGSVTFESTVDSEIGLARNLTIDAATIRFNDNVGAKAGGRLGTATLNGGVSVLNAANFNADEWQFNTAVVLETDATVDGTTSVIFGSTLNSDFGGNRDLTVNSLLTRFEGNVGTAPGGRLGTVTTDAAGTTFLAASDLRAQTWQFNDDVVLEADVVLDATAGVTFGALLNSENGMNHGLTVNGGGSAVTFTGAVGGAVNGTLGALAVNTTGHTHFTSTVNAASVTTSAGGTTQLDGSVTTTGGQTYNNDVTTFNGITLTGTTIAFNDILRPGGTNVGTLNIVGNLNLHSLDWQIASNGSFDQIIVSGGNVTLLGGNITGSLINDFLPANQTSFRIINNTDGNAIAGQFAQGGEMFDTTGRLFEINYAAGGNHLDLTKVPRDRIWSGGGADNLWLTALNWLDGFAPDPEDRLIFGMTVRQANFNNFAAGTLFESITFNAGGFTLSGNALNLSHGLFTLAGAGSNAINLNVTTTQAQNWSIADGTTLTLNGALTLGDELTVSRAGTMQFEGTIDGDHALVVNGAGTVRFGNTVTINSLTTSGGFTQLGANVTTTGLQEYDDTVTLTDNVTLESLASVTFGVNSSLNSDAGGNRDLTVNSPLTRFAGNVGTGDDGRLGTVTTDADGTTFLAANQFLAANWLFNDAVVLEADATVDGSTSVVFGSTLDSDAGGNRDLTVNSPLTRFEGNVGTGDDGRLGTVTTDADGVTHLAANQFLAANWLFNDAVLLEDHATVDGTASVIFGSTLDSLGGPRNLTVISPLTRFEGNVGTAAGGRLGDVETDADGTTFLAADEFRAMSWLFNDAVIVEQDAIVDGTNSVTFASTVNSSGDGDDISDDNSLTVLSDGEVTFEDAVGGAADGRLGFLDVTGTDINVNGGIVNTNDYQRYDGAVWLGNETEMNAGGYVHFTGTVNSVDNDGGKAGNGSAMHSLTVNSDDDVTFDGAVGNIGILGFLEVFAANDININGGYVNTNEHQLYDGAVKLGADTVMDAGTHVTFTRSVDNAVGNNDDNDDDNGEAGADGRASLIVNSGGMVTFNGAVGGGPNGQLRFLEVNANNIDVNGSFVNTEEHQLYNGATRIGGFMTIMLAGGDVTFTETLDSSGDGASSDRSHLRIQSGGQVTFQKAVGGAADGRFASLDITGDQININGGLMQSFGVQEYHGAVRLGMNTLLHTEAGGILIDGTLDSEAGKQVGLTVTTPGLLTLGGAVGGNDQLSSFQRNGGGATAINGGLVRTVNGQNYGSGAVSIGANADLIAGTTVAFGGTVNSANGTHALAIKRNNGVGGNATFGNSVGQNSPLSNLMVEGATTFGGQQGGNVVSITTTQDQTYGDGLGNNDITLLSHATLNGRTITARGQINGQDHDIAINATDMIDLHDDVDVRRFETGQGGTTHLRNGLALTARQLVKIDNALQLHGHTLVSVTEVSPFMFAVEFRSINGAHDLMVDSHSGGIRFNDRIGGTTALNNLSANAMNGGQILFDTLESANGNPFVMLTGNLMLNTDVGPQQDPTVAKIGATGDLWIQSNGNFVMGRGQKLTAIGSVIIDVANAIIGDISALNNIEINANTITILLRPAAEGFDQGVDFVAGGMILFSVIPDLDGEGPQPQFATPNGLGGASIATLQGFLVRALDYVVGDVQEIQDANTSFVFPDLVATGAASTDLSTALAAEMPDEGGTDEADTETSLAGDDVAILAQRGFIVRILENAELAELVQGRGVYIDGRTEPIDVPGIDGEAPVFLSAGLEIDLANVRPQGIDPAILQRSPVLAKQRVSRGLLDSVVSAIDRLRTVVNPETGEQESRIDLVRPALDSMWRMFTADHPGAPAREFPEYLRRIIENPIDDDELEVASEALNFLRDVADLRDGLHAFGMSRREARMALVEIIRPFLAADVSVSNFFEAIEGLER